MEVIENVRGKRTHQINVLDLSSFEKRAGFKSKSFSVVWSGSTEELTEKIKSFLRNESENTKML